MTTQTRPSFYLGEQPEISVVKKDPAANDPVAKAYQSYQDNRNTIAGMYNQARNKGLGGWIQNHPVSSSVLASLLFGGIGAGLGGALGGDDRGGGALGLGLLGLGAGALGVPAFSANRQGRLADAYTQMLGLNDKNFTEIALPLAQSMGDTQGIASLLETAQGVQRRALDQGSGLGTLGRLLADAGAPEKDTAPVALPPIPDNAGGSVLPQYAETTPPLRGGVAESVPAALMQMYNPEGADIDFSGLPTMTPETARALLPFIGGLMNTGVTQGVEGALAPSKSAQNYGAANQSNATAGKTSAEIPFVKPLSEAEIKRRQAQAGLYGQQASVVKQDANTRRINATRPTAASQPNEAALRMMLSNAIQAGDQKKADAISAALAAGRGQSTPAYGGFSPNTPPPSNPGQLVTPPAGAIAKLKSNPTPEFRQFFDAKYGAGASSRYVR